MKTMPLLLLALWLIAPAGAAADQTPTFGSRPQGWLQDLGFGTQRREFLPPEEAFALTVEGTGGERATARWDIAKGYYLYRDKFRFQLAHPGVTLGAVKLPDGVFKEDPEFGRVEVYTQPLQVEIPFEGLRPGAQGLALTLAYQGCAEDGICYPPIEKHVALELVGSEASAGGELGSSVPLPEQDRLARQIEHGAVSWTLATFFGLGILLAFTPCVFPMVPILSGLIAGQGQQITARKALGLSTVFVLTMAATYAGMGVVAGLFGQNLQATFQNPWVLTAFAALFVTLALGMFGFFRIELPERWRAQLSAASHRHVGGTVHGVAAMGLFSALIVGPCVAPPLAGALIYIGKSGDAVLGGAALFALGLGMGLPLLAVGASAGKLLPRVGPWMQTVQAVFGVILLGVAIWLLERILPAALTVLLWGLLLTASAIWLGAFDRLGPVRRFGARAARLGGLTLLPYGAVLMIGAAAGTTDPLRPVIATAPSAAHQEIAFAPAKGLTGLERQLREARAHSKPVMLDLYADWCVECKQLERETFTDRSVQGLLSRMALVKADVTANDEADKELLKALGVFGPPALLFYDPEGEERRAHRLVGFIGAREFREHLDQVLPPCAAIASSLPQSC